MSEFFRYHGIVNCVYFVFLLFVCIWLMDPVISGITFILLGVVFGKSRKKTLPMCFLLMLAALLINPLFNHRGVTTLFYLNDWAITLESLSFGVSMSLFLGAIFSVFSWSHAIMTGDKWTTLLGKVSRKLALVFSMSLEIVPHLRHTYDSIQLCCDGISDKKGKLKAVSCLIGNALEDSIERSDSMKARGYYVPGKKTSILPTMKGRDWYFLLVEGSLMIIIILLACFTTERVQYFPQVTLWENGIPMILYIVYTFFIMLPWMEEGKEKMKWKKAEKNYLK